MVSLTLGSGPKVRRVHSAAIFCALRSGFQARRRVAVEVGLRELIAGPVVVEPDVDHAHEAARGTVKRLAGYQRLHRGGGGAAGVHVEIQRLFPHGNQEDHVPGLAEIFLGDLQLDGLVGLLQRAEKRRGRLAHLEIDGAVLDLHDHVVVELAVEVVEVVVGGAAAIVLRVLPVHVVVVDEAAIEEQAAVRLERARQHVGGVGVGSPVGGGTDAAFRIGLQDDAAEVGNGAVQVVHPGFPPVGYLRIERVEGVQAADGLGASEIDGDRHPHAPRAESVGDARDLRSEFRQRGRAGWH